MKKSMVLLIAIIILAFSAVSCGNLQSPETPSEDFINTSVAQTVNAQIPPADTETPVPPVELPTDSPAPTDEAAVVELAVAIVGPDHNAYYWDESQPCPTQLTSTGDVQEAIISPDGSRIVLVRSLDWSTYTLDMVNYDGSGMVTLMQPADFDALPRPADTVASVPAHLSWLPDSETLAMTTRITYEGPGSSTGETMFLINTNTAAKNALLTVESEWSWDYTYSPDGTMIAISRPEALDIYNADGSLMIANLITFPFVNTASEYAWLPQPEWSADSTSMIVAVPPQDPWGIPADASSVYQWNAGDTTAALKFSTEMTYWPMTFAVITPDLSKILYLVRSGAPEDNLFALKLANIDGSGMREITVDTIYNLPSWSTDGGSFYYHSDTDGAFIATPDSTPVAVPSFSQVREVKWIDSERFLGVSGPTGGWQLLLGSTTSPAMVIFSSADTNNQIIFTTNTGR